MSINAVFFDLGGVILRTEYQAPREHLAERLNLSYEDLVKIVFESETARQASLGRLPAQAHWEAVATRLGRSERETAALRDEFFGGDVLDLGLLDYIRSLRTSHRTGLISNGWADLREYVVRNRFDDAFDVLVISAETGFLKPDPRIYEHALRQLGAETAQAVLVDDTTENVEGARAFGMAGILFRDPIQARRDLEAMLN